MSSPTPPTKRLKQSKLTNFIRQRDSEKKGRSETSKSDASRKDTVMSPSSKKPANATKMLQNEPVAGCSKTLDEAGPSGTQSGIVEAVRNFNLSDYDDDIEFIEPPDSPEKQNSSSSETEQRASPVSDSSEEIFQPIELDLKQKAGEIPADTRRFPDNVVWCLGELISCANHSVLVKGPFIGSSLPPYPEEIVELWDHQHVKMPYSNRSVYTNSEGQEISRWELIKRSLLTPINSFQELKEAIQSYNGGHPWDFAELEDFLEELETPRRKNFFEKVLPGMIRLVLQTPELLTRAPVLLRHGHNHSITMSQKQAACILSNAFLCTFPRRITIKPDSPFVAYPTINFNTLLNGSKKPHRRNCKKQKLRAILNYFERVFESMPVGNLTFTRIRARATIPWENCTVLLPKVFITSKGRIEDQSGMVMVDFANEKIGGGVLGDGCVQEEILFVVYPELICARLFTECLDHEETLLCTGAERFNSYEGYSDNFTWKGNVFDRTPRDSWGRRYTQIIAMDALPFRGEKEKREQFHTKNIIRELSKAFSGFQRLTYPQSCIATGNWGCGAYGGDERLKFLIQWMAAARCGRDLLYLTHGNHKLMCELRGLHDLLREKKNTVGNLMILLRRYYRLQISKDKPTYPSIYQFIHANYYPQDSD